ncbi:MAG: helix-turn-helix transcriptional regulator [archaeon]|nr:helix-turn-helix transcriptional regulator [archaeon]
MDLKLLRKESHISQLDAANAVGVHINTWTVWEKGAGKPTPENKIKIKEIFGIKKFGYHLEGKEYSRRKHVLDFIGLEPEEYEKKVKKITNDLDY